MSADAMEAITVIGTRRLLREAHRSDTSASPGSVTSEGFIRRSSTSIRLHTYHSWELLGQRYAYDFLIRDDQGKTHRGNGRRLEDYYAFGAPICAPADGVVVAMRNNHRDCPWPGIIDPLAWSITGNYVLILHESGEYSLLVHLKKGSVRVRPGQKVRSGEVVEECGNWVTLPNLTSTFSFWTAPIYSTPREDPPPSGGGMKAALEHLFLFWYT
ncbi:MAG: peptidoglycan DD-metalloendopeptidase family protein [Hydrogenibacillus schlegelii]|uniref:Peptidoglycan DD-metalloendopeptidase family protein n=1 Tax=Hydrogenibacillus schlegelii TaxID=1484 RepID=A0A947CVB0_HYDSH|nr:peptidoglycan DD-metalloendopeptidase family protein [Hydrogenibacillus schlegelii]